MKCKQHLSDQSSSVGVCASCLRQRLIAAQVLTQQDPQPPLVFPLSVSPYVSRRESDDTTPSTWAYPRRFYSTPQVGPRGSAKKRRGKFSLISNLFRSRSDKYNSDPSSSSSSSPSSWFFSNIWRKKISTVCYADDDSTANGRIGCRISYRGMSPARGTESDGDSDRSPWRRTPMDGRRTRTASPGKNVSGLAFCLSPLVWPSPNRQGGLPQDSARRRGKPRPWKIADFGRVNHNR